MCTAIIFITKINLHMGCNQISILSKPFKFFWIIVSITKPVWWIPFQGKETFTVIFRYTLIYVCRCLWKHKYRQALVKLRSIRKNFFFTLFFVFFNSRTKIWNWFIRVKLLNIRSKATVIFYDIIGQKKKAGCLNLSYNLLISKP